MKEKFSAKKDAMRITENTQKMEDDAETVSGMTHASTPEIFTGDALSRETALEDFAGRVYRKGRREGIRAGVIEARKCLFDLLEKEAGRGGQIDVNRVFGLALKVEKLLNKKT